MCPNLPRCGLSVRLHNGEHFIRDAWWMLFFPALAISLLVLALNAVGDALNRALDPKIADFGLRNAD